MNPPCTQCSSLDTVWKAKVARWECRVCEVRFEEKAPALSKTAARPLKIFISYGHDPNREFVERITNDLEKRGHEVWIDWKEIGTWDDWRGRIVEGIQDAELAIAFLSIHSTRDPGVCRNEVALALNRFGIVYSILVEQVPLESIPATIAHLQWPDLSRWRELKDGPSPSAYERFYEENLHKVIQRLEGGEPVRFSGESEVLRKALDPHSFEALFAEKVDGFIGRKCCFEAFEKWLNEQPESRAFRIKAGPGFGKTALAVQFAARYRDRVVGSWFCNAHSVDLSDPAKALRSLSYELALRLPDYRAKLLPALGLHANSTPEPIREARERLAGKKVEDLFKDLFLNPLANLPERPPHALVIVIDALDEARLHHGRNELAALIGNSFSKLPKWIGFVVTSRPNATVDPCLTGFKPFEISADDPDNRRDLGDYVDQQILSRADFTDWPGSERDALRDSLVERSEGMILFLHLLREALAEGVIAAGNLRHRGNETHLLHGVYQASFQHRIGASEFPNAIQPLVRVILAAPGPLPIELAAEVLQWSVEDVSAARRRLGSYVVDREGGLVFFHQTLRAWFRDPDAGDFFTAPAPAKRLLADCLRSHFATKRRNFFGRTETIQWEKQITAWLPVLTEAEDGKELEELAELLAERGRLEEARNLFERVRDVLVRSRGSSDSSVFAMKRRIAYLFRQQGDFKQAIKGYTDLERDTQMLLEPNHPERLRCLSEWATTLRDKPEEGEDENKNKKNLNTARQLLGEALRGWESSGTVDPREQLTVRQELSTCLSRLQDHAAAESEARLAHSSFLETFGPQDPGTLGAAQNLATVLGAKEVVDGADDAEIQRHNQELLQLLEDTLAMSKASLGEGHPTTLKGHHFLGRFLLASAEIDKAYPHLRTAREGFKTIYGPDHAENLAVIKDLLKLDQISGIILDAPMREQWRQSGPARYYAGPPEQGPVGRSPLRYFELLHEPHRLDSAALELIPHQGTEPLTREQVRWVCRNPEVGDLTAYACVMAWGGSRLGNYRRSLEDGGERISSLAGALRFSTATRREDFESTREAARSIPGLGISFYTKLLFFLRPKPDAYILDQWTAKSAVLLLPEAGVQLTRNGFPDPDTTELTYERFCKALEACCGPEGFGEAWKTGEEVERTLFDRPDGHWRRVLEKEFDERRSISPIDDARTRLLWAFADTLKSKYLQARQTGLPLPDGCGGFAEPNRLHVLALHSVQFQFLLNRNDVRAQLFLGKDGVSLYDRLVKFHRPANDGRRHDFGQGLTGNGPMEGITRQISLAAEVPGGYASPEAEWPAICESAVEAMATLFQFLEPHLPAPLPLPSEGFGKTNHADGNPNT